MIRSLQQRVNKKTEEFDLARPEEKADLPPEKKEQVQHIAEKQASVEDLTRTMAEKLQRQEE